MNFTYPEHDIWVCHSIPFQKAKWNTKDSILRADSDRNYVSNLKRFIKQVKHNLIQSIGPLYLSWRSEKIAEKIWLRHYPTRRQQLAKVSPGRDEYEDRSIPNKAILFCWHWLFPGNRHRYRQRSRYLECFSCRRQQRPRHILQGSRKSKAKLRNDCGTGNAWRESRTEEWLLL